MSRQECDREPRQRLRLLMAELEPELDLPAREEDPARGEFFIGSADWMYRNLSNRVEVVTPIFAEEGKALSPTLLCERS